ncbi:hypothetical protein J4444_02125 [Candidatus Woesearchaeota archaeon]|nr:hypothetical protein [Candidatus Woesearchaeota archaeon]
MKRGLFIFPLVLFLLLIPLLHAQDQTPQTPYHLKLLAVQEVGDHYEGSDADLYLELKEGTGRVFLDTFPVTKMDTQISTRFAKEIACSHFKLDCDKYDFIYTIKAKSSIIGGPSAGAAIATLTSVALLNLDFDQRVAITGTINSGGIIGPIGGLKEKLEAASKINLKQVLIAQGSGNQSLNQSEEIDLVQYSHTNLSLDVKEVLNLDDILFYISGKKITQQTINLTEDPHYGEIMKGLSNVLCQRTKSILTDFETEQLPMEPKVAETVNARNTNIINATRDGDFYSAASFCFTSNIQLKGDYYQKSQLSPIGFAEMFAVLNKKVQATQRKLSNQTIESISDLQTMMIVEERLNDAKEQIDKYLSQDIPKEDLASSLAYAEERYFSALSWMQFFTMNGHKLVINQDVLHNSCLEKLAEAEQQHQYASLFVGVLPSVGEKIVTAKDALNRSQFTLCLTTASQAKAEANAVLGSIGLDNSSLPGFVDAKGNAAARIIAENSVESKFPILGYSYYRYAKSLQDQSGYLALVYYEYALEMSDLSIYFPEKVNRISFTMPHEYIILAEGIIIGVLLSLIVFFLKPKKKKRKK